MRDIEFRAWDEKLGAMYTTDDEPNMWGPNMWGIAMANGVYRQCNLNGIEYKNDYVLMQYVGRQDKNGKKFFEDDIVLGGQYNGSVGYGRVIFDEKSCQFCAVPLWKFGEGMQELNEKLEIVGNIHEHSSLLESWRKNHER